MLAIDYPKYLLTQVSTLVLEYLFTQVFLGEFVSLPLCAVYQKVFRKRIDKKELAQHPSKSLII